MSPGAPGVKGEKGDKGIGEMGDSGPPGAPGLKSSQSHLSAAWPCFFTITYCIFMTLSRCSWSAWIR